VRNDEQSATVRCHYLTDGTVNFALTIRRSEYFIPAGVLLKCFLEVSDKELYDKLVQTAIVVFFYPPPLPPTHTHPASQMTASVRFVFQISSTTLLVLNNLSQELYGQISPLLVLLVYNNTFCRNKSSRLAPGNGGWY